VPHCGPSKSSELSYTFLRLTRRPLRDDEGVVAVVASWYPELQAAVGDAEEEDDVFVPCTTPMASVRMGVRPLPLPSPPSPSLSFRCGCPCCPSSGDCTDCAGCAGCADCLPHWGPRTSGELSNFFTIIMLGKQDVDRFKCGCWPCCALSVFRFSQFHRVD
jgi:hypothetical protein